jgi:hypothetical protein
VGALPAHPRVRGHGALLPFLGVTAFGGSRSASQASNPARASSMQSRLLKILFATVVSVVAVGCVLAVSAFASGPTLLFPSGGGPTVLIESEKEPNTIKSGFQSTSSKLEGEGFVIELTLLQLTSPVPNVSGIYTMLILKYKETVAPKAECHSEGDAQGEILVPQDTVLLVYDSLSPLGVAGRLAVPEVKILCGTATKIKVKGSVLSLISPINTIAKAGSTTTKSETHCTSTVGEAAETRYWNQSGVEEHTKLEADAGVSFEKVCLLIGTTSTSTISLSPNKEIEIDG